MGGEVPIFAAGGVQVTSARFVTWQQTYPIAAITSVSSFTIYADRNSPKFLTFWCGLWAVIWTLVAISTGPDYASFRYFVVFAFLSFCACGPCILWARSRKDSYAVVITTSGMQVRPVVSEDARFVQAIIVALNQAIAMR